MTAIILHLNKLLHLASQLSMVTVILHSRAARLLQFQLKIVPQNWIYCPPITQKSTLILLYSYPWWSVICKEVADEFQRQREITLFRKFIIIRYQFHYKHLLNLTCDLHVSRLTSWQCFSSRLHFEKTTTNSIVWIKDSHSSFFKVSYGSTDHSETIYSPPPTMDRVYFSNSLLHS